MCPVEHLRSEAKLDEQKKKTTEIYILSKTPTKPLKKHNNNQPNIKPTINKIRNDLFKMM